MDFEGIKKVCVVGHSYGSFLASRLNIKHRWACGDCDVMGTVVM
jgi:ribosomal protein S27AE